MPARFRVIARLDGRPKEATILIDRTTSLIAVRPFRRKRTYELPLAWVAEAVYQRVCKVEAQEKRQAKKLARRKP